VKTKPKIIDVGLSFWVALQHSWSIWADNLVNVKPETKIYWQKRRFKKHCANRSLHPNKLSFFVRMEFSGTTGEH
jgi:hypothetical protein